MAQKTDTSVPDAGAPSPDDKPIWFRLMQQAFEHQGLRLAALEQGQHELSERVGVLVSQVPEHRRALFGDCGVSREQEKQNIRISTLETRADDCPARRFFTLQTAALLISLVMLVIALFQWGKNERSADRTRADEIRQLREELTSIRTALGVQGANSAP